MNLAISSPVSLGSICEGCLSLNRKLSSIHGEESKEFHCILESIDHMNDTTLLCWECLAVLRKVMRFRDQVKSAKDRLVRYMLHQNTLTSLSRLNITKNDITQQITYNDDLAQENKDIEITIEKKDIRRNNENAQSNEPSETIEAVNFIKMEGRDDYDDVYSDEMITQEAVDDKDLKPVLKSDPYCEAVNRKRKKKVKYKFDDSDDEPLKKKAEQKKKEKSDRPKRRATREKPAGVVNNARVAKMLQQLNVDSGQLEMVVLSWEEIEEERAKALTSDAFNRHSYRCYDCVLGFNHRMKLDDHMKKHDPALGSVSCTVCNVRCKDAHSLCAHRRRHRVRWRCCICGAMFSRAGVAADHLCRQHAARAPQHCCSVCGHRETTLGKLRNHLKNHAERQNCELCGKSFRDRSSLRTHLFIHRGEKEYACSHCGKRFLFQKALEVHLVTHDEPLHLYCHQCDMTFKNRMSFYQHMKYNLKHIDPAKLKHVCPICGKRFAKSSRLSEHHTAVHLKQTPISCTHPDCTFACSSRPVLRTHVRMVHRNARTHRNHVCHSCGKAYTTKKTLEGHLRSHSGSRPFSCPVCAATFGYEAALYNHNKLVHLKQSTRKRAVPTAESLPWLPTTGGAVEATTNVAGHVPDVT